MDFVLNRPQYKFQLDEKPQRAFLVTPFEKVSRRARVARHIHETKCGDRRPSPISILTAK